MGRPPKRSVDPFENSVSGKVTVNSKTYGVHTRAPRGSKSEAKLNDKMEETRLRTLSTNAPASLINKALEPFRKNFKGGLFYQFLQSRFSAQAKRGLKFSVKHIDIDPDLLDSQGGLASLKKLRVEGHFVDVNKNYTISRMMNLDVKTQLDIQALKIHISAKYLVKPRFLRDCPYIDGIRMTFIILFPDFEDYTIESAHTILPIRKPGDTEEISFSMDIPVTAMSYMLFCKIEGCDKGEVQSVVSKALALVKADELSHSLKKEGYFGSL